MDNKYYDKLQDLIENFIKKIIGKINQIDEKMNNLDSNKLQ